MNANKNNTAEQVNNFFNLIETAIKAGMGGSKIADALEATGMSRTQALAVVATAGAFLNMESGMTFDEGFKYYAGI
jgi:hypothetical protein